MHLVAAEYLPSLRAAALLDVPANCATPIAAELILADAGELPVTASFDFLQTGPQTWDIEIDTDQGRLLLSHGGGRLVLDGHEAVLGPNAEYPALYAYFADLIQIRCRCAAAAHRRCLRDRPPANRAAVRH
jgi:D-galactose 1-dehydrogenase